MRKLSISDGERCSAVKPSTTMAVQLFKKAEVERAKKVVAKDWKI